MLFIIIMKDLILYSAAARRHVVGGYVIAAGQHTSRQISIFLASVHFILTSKAVGAYLRNYIFVTLNLSLRGRVISVLQTYKIANLPFSRTNFVVNGLVLE